MILTQDNFTRADTVSGWGSAANSDTWTSQAALTSWKIASNLGYVSPTTNFNPITLGAATSKNQDVRVTFYSSDYASSEIGVTLRYIDINNYYMVFAYSNTLYIYKMVAGVASSIAAVAFTATINTFYNLHVTLVGSKFYVTCYLNGASEPTTATLTATDSSITAAGKVGVYSYGPSSTTFYYINFVATDATTIKDTSWRGKLGVQATKDTSWRSKIGQLKIRDTSWRGKISATKIRDTSWRGKISATKISDTSWRGKIGQLKIKDTSWRGKLGQLSTKDAAWRGKLGAQATKDASWRGKLGLPTTKDATWRGKLGQLQNKDTLWRSKVGLPTTKDSRWRSILGVLATKDSSWRSKLSAMVRKDTLWRGLVGLPTIKNASWRGNVSATTSRDTAWRGIIGITGPPQGAFSIVGIGPDTVYFRNFRATRYPDPALQLEPVARIGSTYIGWTQIIQPGTVVYVNTSLRGDGTDWVDVTSQNGGQIPGIFGQPPAIFDTFDSDSSINYGQGSFYANPTVWTWDTANSRLVGVGGNTSFLAHAQYFVANMYSEMDCDTANSAGLILRFSLTGTLYSGYMLIINSSTSGNTANLYKLVNNVITLLSSAGISFPDGTPHRFRLSVIDSTIYATMDGVLLFSITDTSVVGNGFAGLVCSSNLRCYNLRIQPLGDTGIDKYVYTRIILSTSDVTVTPQIPDLAVSAKAPNIQNGVLLPQLRQPGKPLAEYVSKDIDSVAKVSDYTDYIANDGTIYFHDKFARPAPWIMTEADLLAHSVTPTFSADQYRNRQTILGVVGTITIADEKKIADGTTTTWPMNYRLAAAPTILIAGAVKTVGVKGIDIGKDFYWLLNDINISQDSAAVKLASGTILDVWYTGNYDTLVTRDNIPEQILRASIETGTTGIVEVYETVDGISIPAAIVYADGKLKKYAKSGVLFKGKTKRPGLAQGQLLPVFLPSHGLADRQLLITKVTAVPSIENGNTVYTYSVEASDGPNLGSWARVFG